MTTLEELTSIPGNLVNPRLKDWKAQGKKVVGYFCSYVPEEILYAADILPYRVRAPGCVATTLADAYMSHLNCSFVRSCLQFALQGSYDFLDGMVFTNSCDHVRRLYDVLREVKPGLLPFMHFLSVPHKVTQDSTSRYREEVVQFREHVEEHFAVEITEARLGHAVDTYNESRRLLRNLYELRHREKPPVTGAQNLGLVLAGTMIPKEQYNQLLKPLLAELGEREGVSDYRARLMLAGGGGCDNPDYYRLMEDLGGLVVADSLCFGGRSFSEPVDAGSDLLYGLASSYIQRPSCAGMVDRVAERSDFVTEMVRGARVDGVVFQRIRYCDLWGGQLLHLRRALKEAAIPLLSVEREYAMGGTGQMKTRIQAFLERVER